MKRRYYKVKENKLIERNKRDNLCWLVKNMLNTTKLHFKDNGEDSNKKAGR